MKCGTPGGTFTSPLSRYFVEGQRVVAHAAATGRGPPGLPVVSDDVITRVAVVPHPPLLVPELVPGSEQDTAPVRDAVLDAVRWLRDGSAHWLAVGAHHGGPGSYGPATGGSFSGYGVGVAVSLSRNGAGPGNEVDLPLPVLTAGWLRDRAGAETVRVEIVDAETSPAECIEAGRRLGRRTEETALLVLADGSNRHGPGAPGRPDDRAESFDASIATALARADLAALLDLDPGLATELGALGRAPWQVLAGFASDACWRADLRFSGAPFGVGYHVATWERG